MQDVADAVAYLHILMVRESGLKSGGRPSDATPGCGGPAAPAAVLPCHVLPCGADPLTTARVLGHATLHALALRLRLASCVRPSITPSQDPLRCDVFLERVINEPKRGLGERRGEGWMGYFKGLEDLKRTAQNP